MTEQSGSALTLGRPYNEAVADTHTYLILSVHKGRHFSRQHLQQVQVRL